LTVRKPSYQIAKLRDSVERKVADLTVLFQIEQIGSDQIGRAELLILGSQAPAPGADAGFDLHRHDFAFEFAEEIKLRSSMKGRDKVRQAFIARKCANPHIL
jgi:hypothetical protein